MIQQLFQKIKSVRKTKGNSLLSKFSVTAKTIPKSQETLSKCHSFSSFSVLFHNCTYTKFISRLSFLD